MSKSLLDEFELSFWFNAGFGLKWHSPVNGNMKVGVFNFVVAVNSVDVDIAEGFDIIFGSW